MLIDYARDGGILMVPLGAILFVVLVLVLYAGSRVVAEHRRAKRWVAQRSAARRGRRERGRTPAASKREACLAACFAARLEREWERAGATSALSLSERRQLAAELADEVLEEIDGPIDLLRFLSAYAAKLGLAGTILGLCIHFLSMGTDGEAALASQAMAIALYTTLAALGIAILAEPAVHAIERGREALHRELRRAARLLEGGNAAVGADEPPAGEETRATGALFAPTAPRTPRRRDKRRRMPQ